MATKREHELEYEVATLKAALLKILMQHLHLTLDDAVQRIADVLEVSRRKSSFRTEGE